MGYSYHAATHSYSEGWSPAQLMDEMLIKLEKRLEILHMNEATIRKGDKADEFIVEIPGKVDLGTIRSLLTKPGDLEFWETAYDNEILPLLDSIDKTLKQKLYPNASEFSQSKDTDRSNLSLKEQFALRSKPERLHPLFAYLLAGNAFIQNGSPNTPLVGEASNIIDEAAGETDKNYTLQNPMTLTVITNQHTNLKISKTSIFSHLFGKIFHINNLKYMKISI
ncbi:MAG TPA: hypothetical protein VFF27_02915 [Bacteroidia bacterium]|jgi:hypothetical protein|nr:hypothetical protein [Bacteroidia bacterium]